MNQNDKEKLKKEFAISEVEDFLTTYDQDEKMCDWFINKFDTLLAEKIQSIRGEINMTSLLGIVPEKAVEKILSLSKLQITNNNK